MTGTGWEFWDLNFSWFLVVLVSAVLFAYTWMRTHGGTYMSHVDGMAGDEGEDW